MAVTVTRIVCQLVVSFLESFKNVRHRADGTISCYRTDLHQFGEYLLETDVSPIERSPGIPNEFGDLDLTYLAVTPNDVKAYVKRLQANGAQVSTINRKLACIRSFYKFAFGKGWISTNLLPEIEFVYNPGKDPVILSRDQISELFLSVSDDSEGIFFTRRDIVMLRLAYTCCLSITEMLAITEADFHFAEDLLTDPSFVIVRKGRKERQVDLPMPALEALMAYLPMRNQRLLECGVDLNTGPLLLSKHDESITERSCRRHLDRYLSIAGLPAETTMHDIQMTGFAHMIEEYGFSLELVRKFDVYLETARRINQLVEERLQGHS